MRTILPFYVNMCEEKKPSTYPEKGIFPKRRSRGETRKQGNELPIDFFTTTHSKVDLPSFLQFTTSSLPPFLPSFTKSRSKRYKSNHRCKHRQQTNRFIMSSGRPDDAILFYDEVPASLFVFLPLPAAASWLADNLLFVVFAVCGVLLRCRRSESTGECSEGKKMAERAQVFQQSAGRPRGVG